MQTAKQLPFQAQSRCVLMPQSLSLVAISLSVRQPLRRALSTCGIISALNSFACVRSASADRLFISGVKPFGL